MTPDEARADEIDEEATSPYLIGPVARRTTFRVLCALYVVAACVASAVAVTVGSLRSDQQLIVAGLGQLRLQSGSILIALLLIATVLLLIPASGFALAGMLLVRAFAIALVLISGLVSLVASDWTVRHIVYQGCDTGLAVDEGFSGAKVLRMHGVIGDVLPSRSHPDDGARPFRTGNFSKYVEHGEFVVDAGGRPGSASVEALRVPLATLSECMRGRR
ncbi:MAG: hypothetical protein WA971_07820 [Microbacterium sp.]